MPRCVLIVAAAAVAEDADVEDASATQTSSVGELRVVPKQFNSVCFPMACPVEHSYPNILLLKNFFADVTTELLKSNVNPLWLFLYITSSRKHPRDS